MLARENLFVGVYLATVYVFSVYSLYRLWKRTRRIGAVVICGAAWLLVHLVAAPLFVALIVSNDNDYVDVLRFQALDSSEASAIVAAAEGIAASRGGWSTDRHEKYPTVDVAVDQAWIIELVENRVFPLVRDFYNVEVGVVDLFVVKYSTDGQRALSEHRDRSHISFSIALNDCAFGTYFSSYDYLIKNVSAGEAWAHPSRTLHAALPHSDPKTSRYILVGFLHVYAASWWQAWGAVATHGLREYRDGHFEVIDWRRCGIVAAYALERLRQLLVLPANTTLIEQLQVPIALLIAMLMVTYLSPRGPKRRMTA